MAYVSPPLDCSLTLGQIIDLHIAHENRGVVYAFADEKGHITEISHFEFARAAHRAAYLLRPQRSGLDGQVVAIICLTDVLMYQTIVAGCIIAGIVPFSIFYRNSAAAIIHLLRETSSHRLLTTKGSLGQLIDLVSAELCGIDPSYDLSVEEIPLLGQLYPHLGQERNEHPFKPYPSSTTKMDDLALCLHSSGSTGLPKSIRMTHRTLIHWGALNPPAQTKPSPRHAVGALPPVHAFGLQRQLLDPLLKGTTACIYPPASTSTEYRIPPSPTSENVIENAKRAKATAIFTVPSMILDWQSPENIAYLRTLEVLAYGGGPLPSRVGESLVSQGSGSPTVVHRDQTQVDPSDWAWFRFSSRVNIRWEPQGDGTFECQFLTVPETHQPSVENLPDVKGYSTKDLFERHPTKPDLYRIVGRLDDVLVMANGEKVVPAPMENVIIASPFIMGAIIFGRERNQVGVLIEPNHNYAMDPTDEKQLEQFRNLIWPVIEEANRNAPAFARIYKEMILVTRPERPMARAPKNTVIKKVTVALYDKEIQDLYDTIEASGNAACDVEPPSSWSPQDLRSWLKTHASLVATRDILGGRDLFDQGFDSLNATFLRLRIVGALRNSQGSHTTAAAQKISQNFVYAHPSIEELANAIAALVHGDADASGDAKTTVEDMITKYSAGFDATGLHEKSAASSNGTVVLLTGSTGGLGSHVLEILLSLPSVDRVYAFNRKSRVPVSERQREAFVDRALEVTLLTSEKLVYLEGDTSKTDLELPLDVWNTLRDTVTVIIHNAWTLDFNRALSSFESHVKGTRNLIDLARQSPNKSGVRFLFTSSIASAQNWDRNLGPFPEELQLDASVAVGNGYGESKYVSERILAASGIAATSFRIGQVSGSMSNGAWSTTDWVPVMVKSSIALGNFPSNPSGVVAWIPPETVSNTIVDAALSAEKPPFTVNLVHPRPVPWDFIMSTMASMVRLPLVPFADWVKQLEARAAGATADDMERIPGIKLLDFFKASAVGARTSQFSTLKAEALSESMRLLVSLREEDAKQWMSYWKDFLVQAP
ncbi:putative aminoadipate reductase [Mycena olivaceomarginata]|nr:putative aminoadipate reductase [Mycena olivaceomarginata]